MPRALLTVIRHVHRGHPLDRPWILFLPIGLAQLEILTLPEEYRRRWGVETAYGQIEEVRPWTTSRSATFRMILFFASLFMYNMWATGHARGGGRTRGMQR